MEDPRTRLTNIHRVEGVLAVRWTKYEARMDPERVIGPSRELSILANAEASLRKDGRYSLLDISKQVLWHFVLSDEDLSLDIYGDSRNDDEPELLLVYSLMKKSAGILKASDVAAALRDLDGDAWSSGASSDVSTPVSQGVDTNTNARATIIDASETEDRTTRIPSNETMDVYAKFISAVEKSVGYVISTSWLWLPVAPGIFVRRGRNPDDTSVNEMNRIKPYAVDWSYTHRLKVTWLETGFVTAHCLPMTMQDFTLALNEKSNDDEAERMIACPFGLEGVIVSKFEYTWTDIETDEAFENCKQSICQWLSAYGIYLLTENDWVTVCLFSSHHAQNATSPSKSITLPWPRELCFKMPQPLSESSEDLSSPKTGPIRDVLQDIENWKSSREPRTPSAHQEPRKKRKEMIDDDQADDDDYIHLFPKNDGRLDVQNLAGIYPTPPDARPPGMSSTDDRGDHKFTHFDPKTLGDVDSKTTKVTFDDSIDPDEMSLALGNFDHINHIDEDDLFSNMAGGEYGNNGVTEDDFSFFDEPGDTPLEVDATGITTEDIRDIGTVQSLADSPEIHEKAERLALDDKDDMSSNPKLELQKSEAVPIGTTNQIENPDDMEWQHTPRDLYETPDSASKGHEFKSKYGSGGKFSTHNPTLQSTTPSHGPTVRNQIPTLVMRDQTGDSDDTSDESSDEGDVVTTPGNILPEIEVQSFLEHERVLQRSQTITSEVQATDDEEEEMQILCELLSAEANELLGILTRSPNIFVSGDQKAKVHHRKLPESKDHYIKLAQIFADQMIWYKNATGPTSYPPLNHDASEPRFVDPTSDIKTSLFPRGSRCTLEDFVAIGDTGIESGQASRPTIQPLKRTDTGRSEIVSQDPFSQLHPPNIRVKRGDRQMEVSYVALRFWDDLGLAPTAGPKSVTAFCIFPDQEVVRRGVKSFLKMMNSTYTSLRLGGHDTGHVAMKGYRDGLIPISAEQANSENALLALCERFGKSLRTLAAQKQTVVVYAINSHDQVGGTRTICNAFLKLFDSYAGNLHFDTKPSDVVLKVLPLDWVASSWILAMPSVGDLVRLSKEIYDRCPLGDRFGSLYASSSLVEIAEPIPKTLDFKLTDESLANPFRRETFAHVAYSWDSGSAWIAASISDTLGCHSWSGNFLVGNNGDIITGFSIVAKEILGIVEDSIQDVHGRVRVAVYKDGRISDAEIASWKELSDGSLVLLTLDSSPTLFLHDEDDQSSPHLDITRMPPIVPTTPDVPSPDTTNTKQNEEFDPGARAVDLNEEAWGVVRNCGWRTNKILGLSTLAANGLIIKRSRAVMGVTIVHSDREVDMREILNMNNSLICLAKARGLDGESPYHIAMARKAHDGLALF